ncbi:MAG: segregation/condensation protein A [Rhodospirillales bacterium]|nr:MAG: segregation/condensation protein A [Rhodospirillales bacterium]
MSPASGLSRPEPTVAAGTFVVDVEGFEGPLDLLLTLARQQKVDLKQVSILELADQYLAFVAKARQASLDLAAEYLVMAAWLAFLKSRLLLPEPPSPEEPSAESMAEALAFQLERLESFRAAAARLAARPRLGREVFARGAPEAVETTTVSVVSAHLGDLLSAYAAHLCRREPRQLHIAPSELDTVAAALDRLERLLGSAPGWEELRTFLPPETAEGLRRGRLGARATLAATFTASLELARRGRLRLRQARPYGPIYLVPAPPVEGDTS